MATFRKTEIVEAVQYEGSPLTVMHDHLGEQKAQTGDWLLGTERGKIRVMSARQFEAEFKPYTGEDSSSDKREISELTAQIADANRSRENLQAALKDAMAVIADLRKQKAAPKKEIYEPPAPIEILREHPKSSAKTAAKKK